MLPGHSNKACRGGLTTGICVFFTANDSYLKQLFSLDDFLFRAASRNWNQQMAKWNADYANNRDSVVNAYNQNQQQFQTNVNNVLTPAQQEQWQTLIGKPYNFGPDVYFKSVPITTAKPVLK